jgi:hypothetical protein
MTLGEYAWLAYAHAEQQRRADYRFGVLAEMFSGSKRFRMEQVFPSLADAPAGGGRNRWEIEQIPDDWVQIKGEEAEQWMQAMQLERMTSA